MNIKNKGTVLRGLQESLSAMHQQGGDLSLNQMRVLVFIMRRGRVTGTDIINALDLTRPTTSRIVAALSDEEIGRRKGEEPLDFVRFIPDPVDRRVKYLELTQRGQALAAKIVDLFQD